MSDDRVQSDSADESDDESATDTGDSDESLEPGGGPRRVVSDESVDDILASLDETTDSGIQIETDDSAAGTDDSATGTDDSATRTDDEPTAEPTDAPAGAETESTAETDPADAAAEPTATAPEPTADDASAGTTTRFDEDDVPSATQAISDADESSARRSASAEPADGDEPAAADGVAASDATTAAATDELASRVDRGDVTGADVRAAEAGSGRESTPDIDEVELSLDDLETGTGAASSGAADSTPASVGAPDDLPDDAGPLAGSVGEAAGTPESDSTTSDSSSETGDGETGTDESDSPGLLGRLKDLVTR